ncbi:hypothetical protein C8J56DRAFT_1025322, partial [Mycena floridula]
MLFIFNFLGVVSIRTTTPSQRRCRQDKLDDRQESTRRRKTFQSSSGLITLGFFPSLFLDAEIVDRVHGHLKPVRTPKKFDSIHGPAVSHFSSL